MNSIETLRTSDSHAGLFWVLGFAVIVLSIFSILWMPEALLILVAAVVFALFFERLDILLYFLVFTIPFNVTRQTPFGIPVAIENLRFLGFLFLLLHGIVKKRKLRFHTQFDWPLAVIVILLVTSAFRAVDPMYSIKEIIRVLSGIAFFYFAINVIRTREHVRNAVVMLLISGALVSAYGIYQLLIGDYGPVYLWIHPRFETAMSVSHEFLLPYRNRAIATFNTEIELGLYGIVCSSFLGASLLFRRGKRALKLLLLALLLVACILTFTRIVWFTFVVVSFLLVISSPSRYRAKLLFGQVALGIIVYVVVIASGLTDALGDRALDTGPIIARILQYQIYWLQFIKTPLFGVGYGNSLVIYLNSIHRLPDMDMVSSNIHDIYLNILVQFGIVGLLAFMWILFGAILAAVRGYKRAIDMWNKGIFISLGLSFVAFAIAGISDPGVFFLTHMGYLAWLLLGILVVCCEPIRNEPESGSEHLKAVQRAEMSVTRVPTGAIPVSQRGGTAVAKRDV